MIPQLARKHPNLFKTILLVGTSNLLIALFEILDPKRASISFNRITSIALVHRPAFWATLFTVAAAFCLGGIFTHKYQLARVGLMISAAIGAFLSIGFWVSYFSTSVIGISAPIIWTFYALICIINSSEPTANPLSAALQQDIHQTLATERHTNGSTS